MSLNATFSLGTAYSQQGQGDYADDVVDLGGKVFQEGAAEGEYVDEFSQGDQVDYGEEMNDGLQGEVLDLQITEPLDGEFQVGPRRTYTPMHHMHTYTTGADLQTTCTLLAQQICTTCTLTHAHLQTTCIPTQHVNTYQHRAHTMCTC